MTYLDDQKTRMLAGQLDIKGINTNTEKRRIISGFKFNPCYYPVTVNTAASPSITSNLDSWVVDDSSTKDIKQIHLIPNQVLNYGDLIYWLGDYWITTSVDFMGGINYRGSMQKCLSSLKWKDSLGVIKEAYFSLTKETKSGLGIDDGKVMIIPKEIRYITIQKNVETLKISKLQRFILDNDRCWKVTNLDTLKTGIIELTLEETADLNPSKDNVALRIADYVTTPTVVNPVGTIYITSSSLPISQIKVTQTKVFQSYINSTLTPVNWEVYDVSKTITTNLATIQSSTTTSCTLLANSSGLYGSIQLKATLQTDATQFFWLKVDVKSIS